MFTVMVKKDKAMTVMENSLPKHGYDVDSELTPIDVQAKISFPTYYWSTFVTKENRNKNYAAMKKAGVKISKDDADRPYYYQVYASKRAFLTGKWRLLTLALISKRLILRHTMENRKSGS